MCSAGLEAGETALRQNDISGKLVALTSPKMNDWLIDRRTHTRRVSGT